MGKISTSPRYVIDIAATDPFALGELRRVNSAQIRKMRYF